MHLKCSFSLNDSLGLCMCLTAEPVGAEISHKLALQTVAHKLRTDDVLLAVELKNKKHHLAFKPNNFDLCSNVIKLFNVQKRTSCNIQPAN